MLIPGLMLLVADLRGENTFVLRFCGWLFGNEELIDAYVFILYLINKVLGILLAPFLVILAFCKPEIARNLPLYINILYCITGCLQVRKVLFTGASISLLQQIAFFLYLCAFEVVPVLIITKVLLTLVNW